MSLLDDLLENGARSHLHQIQNFPAYTPRQDLTKFLCRYEIFKRILNVQGSIIECGVFLGGGLMTWAQLSAIFEPTNHQRRIIGFDTFGGIKSLCEKDGDGPLPSFSIDSEAEIRRCIELYDINRFVGHVPKVELVRGDECTMIPKYVKANPHLMVSLLSLDFDIYQPTRVAIEELLPCMGLGSIIVLDEANNPNWPGETAAIRDLLVCFKWERFNFGSTTCYAVI